MIVLGKSCFYYNDILVLHAFVCLSWVDWEISGIFRMKLAIRITWTENWGRAHDCVLRVERKFEDFLWSSEGIPAVSGFSTSCLLGSFSLSFYFKLKRLKPFKVQFFCFLQTSFLTFARKSSLNWFLRVKCVQFYTKNWLFQLIFLFEHKFLNNRIYSFISHNDYVMIALSISGWCQSTLSLEAEIVLKWACHHASP